MQFLQMYLSLRNVGVFYNTKYHGVFHLLQEGPLRPVVDCIDLLSDSEDEGCSSLAGTVSCCKEYFFHIRYCLTRDF